MDIEVSAGASAVVPAGEDIYDYDINPDDIPF
jgi:hypothetical protein